MNEKIKMEKERFYVGDPMEPAAELKFEERGEDMIITHTIVHPEERGKGLATELVRYAEQYAEDHRLEIVPVCSFAKEVLRNR
ncbi:N-acetyltransferase [Halobacillus salinarum]|uniref:N-acetyltransferase n=1 Tax=Halobacillus salinarum TaxID=2932257 RepID=A0ABY4EIS8_9BACI|nr:GNAT family N-acetyltransferase [Halobacillus salinarum]UOQ44391.1 N-acetyltransferase [Halobacillus salinarum]